MVLDEFRDAPRRDGHEVGAHGTDDVAACEEPELTRVAHRTGRVVVLAHAQRSTRDLSGSPVRERATRRVEGVRDLLAEDQLRVPRALAIDLHPAVLAP